MFSVHNLCTRLSLVEQCFMISIEGTRSGETHNVCRVLHEFLSAIFQEGANVKSLQMKDREGQQYVIEFLA